MFVRLLCFPQYIISLLFKHLFFREKCVQQ